MANGLIGKVTAGGGTHLIASTAYFTCETTAATTAKIAKAADTSLDSFTVITGMTIYIKFTYANGVASPTLTLQTNGGTELLAAKSIKRYGTTAPSTTAATSWRAGAVVAFTYDGTNWVEVSSLDDNDNTLLRTYKAYETNVELPLIGGSTGSTSPAAPTGETSYAALYGQIPKTTANRATYNLSTGKITVPGGIAANITGDVTGISNGGIYLTSNTAADTAAKTASYTGFILLTGSSIYINFSETNTQNNPTLNVNSTGAKAIYYKGVRVIYQGLASGIIYHMIYDGTYWQIVNDIIPLTGTCTTAATTSAKTVTCPGFVLYEGATVKVKFNSSCDAVSFTLNVNNTGAKPICWIGRTSNLYDKLMLNHTYEFVYDGTNYNVVGDTFQHYVSPDNVTYRYERLTLGNSTDYATTGGLSGDITLYGTGADYTTIYPQPNGSRGVYLPNYAGNMYLVHAGNNNAVGTSTKPVHVAANGRVTEGSTYAGGTAVTLNGTSKGASTASFYAPTAAGTANQVLKSTAGVPEWVTVASVSNEVLTIVS